MITRDIRHMKGNNMNSIMNRRSIRKFTPQPVEREKLIRVLRAAMQAPSAKNRQPWEFIVVTDSDTKAALAGASPYGGFTAGAPCAIVPLAVTGDFPGESPWWCEDLSAAVQNMLLQLEEEGLGGCWIGIWPDRERVENVRKIFGLDSGLTPFCIIACGYKGQERPFEDRFDESRVHWERY